MLIDDIKKSNIEAMKAHDQNSRSVYSIIVSRYMELKTNGSGKEVTDADVLSIIKKLDKELDEEKDSYLKAERPEQASAIDLQKKAIAKFIPEQLSEEKVRELISKLDDKSIPSVMRFFKTNFQGKVDMSLVNRVARGL